MKEKYIHFFNDGEYIIGSKENQIERFRDYLRETDSDVIKYISGKWNHSEEEYLQREKRREQTRLDIRELEAWTPE